MTQGTTGTAEEVERRRQATAALRGAQDDQRVARLLEALGDLDWRVRKEAVSVAREVIEAWDAVGAVIGGLAQGENVGLRNAALEAIESLGPRSVPALRRMLPEVEPTARKFLAQALGAGGEAAVDELTTLLDDPDPNTQQSALEALARIAHPRAIRALRNRLTAPDPVQRLAVIDGLVGREAALDADELAPLLADRMMRRSAVRLLAFVQTPSALAPLGTALEDETTLSAAARALSAHLHGDLRDAAGQLARAASEATADRLAVLAADDEAAAREAATVTLLHRADARGLGGALAMLAEDRLPSAAVDAFRTWGEGAVEPLLSHPVPGAPRAAALELASDLLRLSPSPDARLAALLRGALREAIEDPDPTLVRAAAEAMLHWAQPEDATALFRAAQGDDPTAARPAGRALRSLAERAPDAVEPVMQEAARPVRASALPAALLTAENDETEIVEGLSAADPATRRAAVEAVLRLTPARALDLAGYGLADDDLGVQRAAVRVLEVLSDGGGVAIGAPRLRAALGHAEDSTVAAAASALGRMGDADSVTRLATLVTEARPRVAVAALEALRRLGGPGHEPVLDEALGASDPELVKEALRSAAAGPVATRAPRLSRGLAHPAWDVRRLAVELITQDDDVRASLRSALEARLEPEDDPAVRALLAETLGLDAAGER